MGLFNQAAEQLGWRQRNRANMRMSAIQLIILRTLHQANESGFPWQPLEDVHPKTLRYMIHQDWIVRSVSELEAFPRYRITGRGQKAMRVFDKEPRRFDGICCRCNKRQRQRFSTGVLAPYCRECTRKINHRQWELKLYEKRGICPRCQKRPKHVTASGRVRPYCKPCRRAHSREAKERQNQRNLERIAAGEVLLCYTCKERPREVANGWVRDYCPECRRAYARDYQRRQKARIFANA